MKYDKHGGLSFFCACLLCLCGWSQVQLPDKILSTLKPSHPRLLVKSLQEFEDIKIRSRTDDFLKLSIRNVIENADSVLEQPVITFMKLGKPGIDLRQIYFRTLFLSMCYRLTEDKKYSTRLWSELEAESKFPDWNQEVFIITGGMLQCFAIAYDWLYDVWTADQRGYLKRQIISRGLVQGLRYHERLINKDQFNWVDIDHNWSAVCNGGLILGSLAIADEEPVLSEHVLKLALPRYTGVLKQFSPDGAYVEGPNYWWFAMAFGITPTLASLETALGSDYGLSKIEGFSKSGLFIESMGGANHKSFNYADAELVTTRYPELFWIAGKYNQPDLTEVQKQYSLEQMKNGMWPQSPLELLWYKPAEKKESLLLLDNYYRGAEIASLRSSWNDSAWFVAFKAGDNGVNHGHLDIGTYVLDYNGQRWLMDLGFENYNVPGYFGDANTGPGGKRWTYYRTRAEGHNTIVVNPDANEDQNIAAKTKFEKFTTTPKKSFGIMDITDAYQGQVKVAKRGIALINRNTVLVQDEIIADKSMNLYWFAHTKATVTLSANKKRATLKLGGKTLYAQIKNPSTAFFYIADAKPLATSPQPIQNNKNEGISKLSIHIEGMKNVVIAVEYTGKEIKNKILVEPLSKW